MRRGIVYVAGADSHILNQSASLVADRIARSLRDRLKDKHPFSYRIRVDTDARWLVPDISLDIASIEVAKGDAWESALEILEVKYQSRFFRRFAQLTPLSRIRVALVVLIRSVLKSWKARRAARVTETMQPHVRLGNLTPIQVTWLRVVALTAVAALPYWLFVALLAVIGLGALSVFGFKDILDAMGVAWPPTMGTAVSVGVFLAVAAAFRPTFVEWVDRLAVEAFASMEYLLDDSRYLSAPNAILSAIEFATERGYGKVDLLSYSVGAVLASDAIFPRRKREQVWSPFLAIDYWITLGYPYDLIRSYFPDYFAAE
jgi:hypothetical protein